MKGPLQASVIVWLRRAVFGFAVLSVLYRAFNGTLLHQLAQPVLIFPHADNVYWLLHILQLPELLTGNYYIALAADLALLATAGLALVREKSTLWPRLYSLFLLLYFVAFHTYFGHHGHSLVGLLFGAVPFWFRTRRTVTYAMRGVRFYALFAYVSAALYKVFRGSAFSGEHLGNVLRQQNVDLLWNGTSSARQELMLDLTMDATICAWLASIVVVSQLLFVVGFFTRRFDAVLILIGLLFHLGTWVLMDINFWEITVLYVFLLPGKKVQKWAGAEAQASTNEAPKAANKASALSKHS